MGEVIVVRDLVKRYSKKPVLTAISFSIVEGDFAVILGPSGCGKTTLLNILGGLDKPTSGSVSIDGNDIVGLGEDKLARLRLEKIGFVFQDYNLLLDLTVRENVELPLRLLRKKSPEQVDDLLHKFNIEDISEETANKISGGEAQRTAIARALVNKPRILLADEPTGNLDKRNGDNVIDMLWNARAELGISVVIATHDERTAKRSSNTMHLNKGRVERAG